MAKKTTPTALSNMVTETTIEAIQGIEKLHVCSHAPDAASAVREGAILLGISRVDNDKNGDGFRYLIGLRRGTQFTPHLSCFFINRSKSVCPYPLTRHSTQTRQIAPCRLTLD